MTVGLRDIVDAASLIRDRVRITPVMEVDPKDFGLNWGGKLSLKLEGLQHTGSFKPRGVFTTLLSEGPSNAPVTAFSGGNHGAAVAYAAEALGRKATIFVPEYAPKKKVDKIRGYGADLRIVGETIFQTIDAYNEYRAETGATAIHAYGAPMTIAGQGTVGLEWAEQCPGLDSVLVAVGGGGLISGVATAMQTGPDVIGVEPVGACCAKKAREAGGPVDMPPKSIAADSLGAPSIEPLNHELIEDYVSSLVTVEDDAIREAQLMLWRQCGLAVEAGAATALAALTSGVVRPEAGAHIGALVCGTNVDLATLEAA